MRNRHATQLNIATWVLEYFGKPLSLHTVKCCTKYNSNRCYARRKLYNCSMQRWHQVLWARAHLRWSRRQWKCSNSACFEKPSLVLPKTKNLSWYGGCISANDMGDSHVCEGHGGVYWDYTVAYRHQDDTRQCQASFSVCYNRDVPDCLPAVQICLLLKMHRPL